MLFFLSAAVFAALLVAFRIVVARSRANPAMFAGEMLVTAVAVLFTGGFVGAFGSMIAAASVMAPSVFVAVAVSCASAAVIMLVVSRMMRRPVTVQGSPIPG